MVSASKVKGARAQSVGSKEGEAKLAGRLPALEEEMAGLTYAGGYEGPGSSPDRADAMVWAMTELLRPPGKPAVRVL